MTISRTPQDVRDVVTYNSSEAKPHRLISFTAKNLWSRDKSFQVHTFGGFNRIDPGAVGGSWSGWNLIPAPYLGSQRRHHQCAFRADWPWGKPAA